MATNNDIKYISFTFENEEQSNITPNDVEVEITALDSYLIAQYTTSVAGILPTFNGGYIDTCEVSETESNGIYTVKIYSKYFPTSIKFQEQTGLLTVDYLNVTSETVYVGYMFYGCTNLISVNTSNWDTSGINNMEYMFCSCSSLTTLDVSNFNTSNVTDMGCMFCYCNLLTALDVSNWNTNKVTETYWMFKDCNSLIQLNLSNWNTSNVTDMSSMFAGCTNLTTLDISYFDTTNVTDMSAIFQNCSSLASIIMNNSDYNSVNKIITELPTRTADSMGTLNIAEVDDINQVNTTTAQSKFWNVESVIEQIKIAEYKFDNTLYNLFPEFNEGFEYTYEDKTTDNIVTRTIYSTELPTEMIFGGKNWYVSNADRTNSLIEVLQLNTSELTTMRCMFFECRNVTSINTNNWDTSNVEYMDSLFHNCTSLESLDISNFNTENVKAMNSMFNSCIKLSSIENLNSWNTSKVTSMEEMFAYCYRITSLDLSNWNTNSLTSVKNMFKDCSNLVSLNLNNWNVSQVTAMNYMFSKCSKLTELNILNWHLNTNVILVNMFESANSLTTVEMNNSDYISVNKIIEQLPTRTSDSMGTLNIVGVDDFNQVNIEAAESKNWAFSYLLVARYTFDRAIAYNVLPEVNDGFKYTYKDIATDYGFITREIYKNTISDVDIADCKIYDLGYYSEDFNKKLSQPIILDNEMIFTYDPWDSCFINLQEYEGKEVTISFDLGTKLNYRCEMNVIVKANEQSYSSEIVISEIVTEENKVVHYNKTFTVPANAKIELEGMNIELTNIQIICDGDNLFPKHMSTKYDFSSSKNNYVNRPCYYDNKLVYSHYWNDAFIDVSQYDNKEITISFDVDILSNAQYGHHLELRLEGASEDIFLLHDIDESFSHNRAITIDGHRDKLYIGGAGVKLSNLSIIVKDALSEPLTKMRFGYSLNEYGDENMANALLEVNYLDTSNVTAMNSMFQNCTNLTTIDTSNFNTSNVTAMQYMFYGCYNLTSLDLSNFDTSNVVNMQGMFEDCLVLESIDGLSSWNVSSVTNMGSVFNYCHNLQSLNLSGWDVSNVTNMDYMFRACKVLTELDVSNFDTGNVTNMERMFYECTNLTSLDLSNFDTSNVVNMKGMFEDCFILESIDGLSSWNVSSVTNMESVFNYCHKLKSLNLSGWDVSNVTNMYLMFISCYDLTSLNLNNWNISNVTNMTNTFTNCTNLALISMNNSDYNSVNKVITQLPTRTSDSIGTLYIVDVDDFNQVDITTARSKFWSIRSYTSSISLNNKSIQRLFFGSKKIINIFIGEKKVY